MSNLKDDNWKVGIFYETTDGSYRLCGYHVDVHTDMKSIRTERQSDQSIQHLVKAVPTEEYNGAHTLRMVRCGGVLEPIHLQLPRFEMVPKFSATLKVASLLWILSSLQQNSFSLFVSAMPFRTDSWKYLHNHKGSEINYVEALKNPYYDF